MGTNRQDFPGFFRFFMDYTFGTSSVPEKVAKMMRSMRHTYHNSSKPIVNMVACMIGFYDRAPPRVCDIFIKVYVHCVAARLPLLLIDASANL